MRVEKEWLVEQERKTGRRIRNRYFKFYDAKLWFHANTMRFITPTDNVSVEWNVERRAIGNISYKGGLRDYQYEGLLHIVEHWCGLISLKTWWGKTHIIMACTAALSTKTLIVVHNVKTLKEMEEKFSEFTSAEVWLYYGAKKEIKDITITTKTSFIKANWFPWEFDFIIFDECDTGVTDKLITAIVMSDCISFMGLTGTPDRSDLSVNQLTLLYWPLCEIGWYQLLPSKVFNLNYNWSEEEKLNVDYTRNRHGIKDSIVANETRREVVTEALIKIAERRYLPLVLVDRIEDINLLYKDLKWKIKNIFIIHWNTKIVDDEKAIETCVKEWWVILWSIDKMYRGIDIPRIDTVIIASSVKFKSKVIQATGRMLRSHPNKKDAQLYIINDSILNSQRYEQNQAIYKEYKISPTLVSL